MDIAPGITSTEWRALRLDDPMNGDWEVAITILDRRIRERYIEPIDYLIAGEATKQAAGRRFGFTVMAVDCLLVETLGAFIEGLEDTRGKSEEIFSRFLLSRASFASEFKCADVANQFYKEFRCGILHQAEIGGSSKVWSVGPLLQIDHGRIIVNRNEFHERIKREFESYLSALRDVKNSDLRVNFKKKMDWIARY